MKINVNLGPDLKFEENVESFSNRLLTSESGSEAFPTCYIDRHYISANCLGLLPHPFLWCWKTGDWLHLHIDCRLVSRSKNIQTGGEVDGVQDQWCQRSFVVQNEALILV